MRAHHALRTALVSAAAAHVAAHGKTKRVLVKTVKLADKVSKAKVYQTGATRRRSGPRA